MFWRYKKDDSMPIVLHFTPEQETTLARVCLLTDLTYEEVIAMVLDGVWQQWMKSGVLAREGSADHVDALRVTEESKS